MLDTKPRVVVIYNRDFEGADADPENKAREDIKDIAEHVMSILLDRGCATVGLGITDDVFAAISSLRDARPDVIFNLCESIGGDNRFEPLLPMLMDREGFAYTGSGPLSLALALHKNKAKEILRARGIPTPEAVFLTSPDIGAVSMPFPLIVKPSREDASVGITRDSVVWTREALEQRVAYVLSHYRQPVLVERYIEGREIYVSMLGSPGGKTQVFPFYEIDFSDMPADRPRIVSFEGKWVESSDEYRGTKPIRCVNLSAELEARIAATALAAFETMELRDYARVDIRLAADGTPFVIDVNPNCDLSDVAGGFSKAAKAAGLSYQEVILRIVELAVARRPNADTIPLSARSRSVRRGQRTTRALPTTGTVERAARSRARSG
ncbi:MAG TPA: D-alanine--D-alanine ligase [Polyangia bacterium]|jgi:D-alanine-D-alanine ligase|nr:D-alanine--D-alanine ligase [Polyangia bacterium]